MLLVQSTVFQCGTLKIIALTQNSEVSLDDQNHRGADSVHNTESDHWWLSFWAYPRAGRRNQSKAEGTEVWLVQLGTAVICITVLFVIPAIFQGYEGKILILGSSPLPLKVSRSV